MTTTLGIIGAGNIGNTVARLALAAGIDVVLSNSRGPGTLAGLVAKLGEHARAATPAEAAQAGQFVVVSVPFGVYRDLPVDALAGRTVIDTMNYYPDRDGHVAELDVGVVTSSTLVQQHLAGAHVVKAFNNIDFVRLSTLARPPAASDRSALPIAGDDPDAKTRATGLLNVLGYDVVNIGTLADSWRSQPYTPIYVNPYLPPQPQEPSADPYAWFRTTSGTPVPTERVRELVNAMAPD
jgi:8-hydroxy-5-deazaflavin:NADPH oxidoreductase